jgi:enoyl-CoA hydratase/carnithine racemase
MKMTLPHLVDSSLELSGRVALLTLRRNDVRNALTGTSLIDDILLTLDWADRTPEVSVLILTGEGSAFSSGGNVHEMVERRGLFAGSVLEIQDQYRRGIQKVPLAFERSEVVVVAAVNGPAIGAGFDLACMCDLRLASTNAVVGETFVKLGIIPGDGGAWILQRLVGYQRAAELAFTGRLVKAEEALALGIFLEVTEPEGLLPRARELGAAIAAAPPHAVRLTKRLMKHAQRGELSDFLDLCACFQGMSHHTEDHAEAIGAFLDKRPPVYSGR